MATGGGRGATTSAFWTTLCRMVAVASSFSSSRAAGSAALYRCRWARRAGRPCASSLPSGSPAADGERLHAEGPAARLSYDHSPSPPGRAVRRDRHDCELLPAARPQRSSFVVQRRVLYFLAILSSSSAQLRHRQVTFDAGAAAAAGGGGDSDGGPRRLLTWRWSLRSSGASASGRSEGAVGADGEGRSFPWSRIARGSRGKSAEVEERSWEALSPARDRRGRGSAWRSACWVAWPLVVSRPASTSASTTSSVGLGGQSPGSSACGRQT